MSPRRMDISSLLCKDDSSNKQNTAPLLSQPPLSPPLNDPVILAPHLRGRHTQQHHLPPPSATTTTSTYNHTLDDRQVLSQPAPTLRQTPSVDHLPSSSTKFLHMSQHNLEHASLPPEFTRQPSFSSSLTSPTYTERPRTIDALLHHPPAFTRPSAPSQMSPSEHYSRPSSSHSPTSVISLLNHPVQYSPDSQSPSSSVASYSPTASRDTRQEASTLNTNVSPGHSTHRSTESPIAAYQPSRPPISTSRPSPLTLPHTFPRSAPDVLHPSQHRALSSTFSHPYSPTEMVQQRHASGPDYMSPSASTSASAPSPPVAYITSSAPASAQAKLRSPFLGLEALVHVASEERRRISGGSDVSGKSTGSGLGEWNRERELGRENEFVREREREWEWDRDDEGCAHAHGSTNPNPSPVYDREMPSRSTKHYGYPITHVPPEPHPRSYRSSHSSQTGPLHQHPSMSYEDEARPHKRHRGSRSPSPSRSRSRSPGPRAAAERVSSRGELTSPRVRRAVEIRSTGYHNQSPANVTDNYPTARQHAHQPYRHVESPSSLVSIAPAPGVLVAGIDDRVGPAPTPFPPPLSGSYAASNPVAHTTPAPLQPASPRAPSYVHHPIQVPSPTHHSFPHNQSPHQHSPQHLRPQLHHSHGQSQTASSHPAASLPTTTQSMPPSYGYGPKMTGGAGVLRHDSPPRREVLQHESSPREAVRYEGLRHEASREQPKYESMSQGRYELSTHAPLQAPVPRLARAVWDDEDDEMGRMDVQTLPDNDKCREGVVPRKQVQLLHPQPPTSPHVHPERPNKRKSEHHEAILVKKVEVSSEHQHQPMRVWEERPPAPGAPRRVSPTPILYAASSQVADKISKGQEVLGETNGGHDEQPVVEYQVKDEVADKSVSPPSLSPTRYISPSLAPITARSPTPPVHHTRIDPCPPQSELSPTSSAPVSHPEAQPISPVQSPSSIKSEPRTSTPPPKISSPECSSHPLDSPVPVPAALPVPELQFEHHEPQPGHSSTLAGRGRSGPETSRPPSPESEPIESELTPSKGEPIPEVGVMHDAIVSDGPIQEPSLEHVQPPTLTQAPGPSGSPEIQPKLECLHSQSWTPPQLPLPVSSPVKEEPSSLPDGIPINHPKPSPRRSPEPERLTEQQQAVTRLSMMDVDEELLSLVEDHVPSPATVLPAKLNGQAKSKSATPFTVGRSTGGSGDQRPSESVDGSSSSMPSQKLPAIIADQEKDRASMPPPAPLTKKAEKVEKDNGTLAAGDAAASKKKEGTSKLPAKPKQPAKSRAKPAAKTKVKPGVPDASVKESSTKGGFFSKGGPNASARSRSASAMPGGVDDAVPDADADDSDREDDKLYCVCKTRYDEDKMMIACDRCDEWYHTQCVNMPDPEIDLVDQFICPPCIHKLPDLQTTWKRRCVFGMTHENPSSSSACHKPSRGAFSKYCSDECGIKYMQSRIAQWENSGGTRDLLWDSVKNAEKREGVVVRARTNGVTPHIKMGIDGDTPEREDNPPDAAAKRRSERDIARLNARLEQVVKEREMMKHEMDMVLWRENVVGLASERAEKVDECGWDQRLCFGEEEWADFGAEVVESFEEGRAKTQSGDDAMQVDGATASHGEWWCSGKKKCERHAGWQKLRAAEVLFDKETKEGILSKLTTCEREIRKGIEDILYPQAHTSPRAPSKPSHPEVQLNGAGNSQPGNGNVSERGKKKKL